VSSNLAGCASNFKGLAAKAKSRTSYYSPHTPHWAACRGTRWDIAAYIPLTVGRVILAGVQDWVTFRQALGLGGKVRKGEHGTTVVYADRFIPDGALSDPAHADGAYQFAPRTNECCSSALPLTSRRAAPSCASLGEAYALHPVFGCQAPKLISFAYPYA
jgi:hypothetical protein